MGMCCCKSKEELLEFETDTQNNYGVTYPCNRQEHIFQTRPPCWSGHQCSCPCHNGGVCIFKNGIPNGWDKLSKAVSPMAGISFQKRYPQWLG